jgi:hypothetical protein
MRRVVMYLPGTYDELVSGPCPIAGTGNGG